MSHQDVLGQAFSQLFFFWEFKLTLHLFESADQGEKDRLSMEKESKCYPVAISKFNTWARKFDYLSSREKKMKSDCDVL